jgi:hypothetical protein
MTVEARLTELEEYTRRIRPATDGQDGWVNFIETRLLQERSYVLDVVTHALAMARDEILNTTEATIEKALSRRVRGTYDPKSEYGVNDVIALDGGSFIARKDNPGPCPGAGWQLLAKQGGRGIAGPPGERGPAGKSIVGWIVDRSCYRVTPKMSDGTLGSPLELRALFEQSEDSTAA